eukprot:c12826_g2_i1.p1 GENE.c12826_g2_i1~~c12826_g2_i1.p1  ORF type:complete len:1660 (+),score=407.99 c12826_g2_i1:88-5067(+)
MNFVILVCVVVLLRSASATVNITTQPESQTVDQGSRVVLSVEASTNVIAYASLEYRWLKNGEAVVERIPDGLSGQGTSTLQIVSPTTNATASYTCVVSDTSTSSISVPAVVVVRGYPLVVSSPPSVLEVNVGNSVVLNVSASNIASWGPLSLIWYRWESGRAVALKSRSGISISNATVVYSGSNTTAVALAYSTLTISSMTSASEGLYFCEVHQLNSALYVPTRYIELDAVGVPTTNISFHNASYTFVPFEDIDTTLGAVNGRVTFLRSFSESANGISGYKLYWATSKNASSRILPSFYTVAAGDWNPLWRQISSDEIFQYTTCTTLSGNVVVNVTASGTFDVLGFDSAPGGVRCDIDVSALCSFPTRNILGVRGKYSVQPFYSAAIGLQQVDNVCSRTSWSQTCADHSGTFAFGTEMKVVDGGANGGKYPTTSRMTDHDIVISETSVGASEKLRFEMWQPQGRRNFRIANITLEITELGLDGPIANGAPGSLHGVEGVTCEASSANPCSIIHGVSFNKDGEGSFDILNIVDISTSSFPPLNVSLISGDINPEKFVISGTLQVTRATNESGIFQYNVYWGSGGTGQNSKYPDRFAPSIATAVINKTDTASTIEIVLDSVRVKNSQPFQSNVILPTHLLVFASGVGGEGTIGVATQFPDVSVPVEPPTSVSVGMDQDSLANVLHVSLTILPAPVGRDSDITAYHVYFGNVLGINYHFGSFPEKIPSASTSPIASVATGASGVPLTVTFSASIPSSGDSNIPTRQATHIMVFSANSDGENPEAVIAMFTDSKCGAPVGISNSSLSPFGQIPEANFNASGFLTSFLPAHARLNDTQGWCSNSSNSGGFISVLLDASVNLTSIATQGVSLGFVTSFNLEVLISNEWTLVTNVDGTIWTPTANSDASTIVYNDLPEPISLVTGVRIAPVTWSSRACIRFEAFGCPSTIPYDVAASVSFEDNDLREGSVSGTVVISQPTIVSNFTTHWLVYLSYGTGDLVKAAHAPLNESSVNRIDTTFGVLPITVTIPIATAILAGATHLLIVGANGVGPERQEASQGTEIVLYDQIGPNYSPVSLRFSDTAIEDGQMLGVVVWHGAMNEIEVDKYAVYLGNSFQHPIGDVLGYVSRGPPQTTYRFSISQRNIGDATHILVFSVAETGDTNPTPGQVRIEDLVGPRGQASELSFSDTNRQAGLVTGTFSFTAADDSSITRYELWWIGSDGSRIGSSYVSVVNSSSPNALYIDTNVPVGAVGLTLLSRGGNNLAVSGPTLTLLDAVGAFGAPSNATAFDTNSFSNVFSGNVTWLEANPVDTGLVYVVWFGNASLSRSFLGGTTNLTYMYFDSVNISGISQIFVYSSLNGTFHPTPSVVVLEDLIGSSHVPIAMTFVDQNRTQNAYSGTVSLVPPTITSNISSYQVWTISKANVRSAFVVEILASGTSASVSFATNDSVLAVFSKDSNNQLSNHYFSIKLVDQIGPLHSPKAIRFNNTTTDNAKLIGQVIWTEPSYKQDILRYEVWLGASPVQTIGSSHIAAVEIGSFPSVRISTHRLGATHILVFSVDSNGIQNPTPGFRRIIQNTNIILPRGASIELQGSRVVIGAKQTAQNNNINSFVYPTSCAMAKLKAYTNTGLRVAASGYFVIQEDSTNLPRRVYCDMTNEGVEVSVVSS